TRPFAAAGGRARISPRRCRLRTCAEARRLGPSEPSRNVAGYTVEPDSRVGNGERYSVLSFYPAPAAAAVAVPLGSSFGNVRLHARCLERFGLVHLGYIAYENHT